MLTLKYVVGVLLCFLRAFSAQAWEVFVAIIKERVEVLRRESRFAWVKPVAKAGCHGCGNPLGSCGQSRGARPFWSLFFNQDLGSFRVGLSPEVQVENGDILEVNTDSMSMAIATLLGYLLPMLCMLLGATFARRSGDLGVLIGLLMGFLSAVLLQRIIMRFPFVALRLRINAQLAPDESM